jgi:hypothetical protein
LNALSYLLFSIKLDSDVLEYYKSKEKGSQTRIHKILQKEMLRETAPSFGKEHDTPEHSEDS